MTAEQNKQREWEYAAVYEKEKHYKNTRRKIQQ